MLSYIAAMERLPIERLMAKLRMNRDDVADIFQVSPRTVLRWENGETPVPVGVTLTLTMAAMTPGGFKLLRDILSSEDA